MSYVILVEHEGQKIISKVSFTDNETVTVGRGWESDVVIEDTYIDANHMTFSMDENGKAFLSDLSSTNGTLYKNKKISNKKEYQLGDKILIGDSVVSLLKAEASVAPALKQGVVQKASRYFSSGIWVFVAAAIAGVSIYGIQYWRTSYETTIDELTQVFGYAFIGMLAWCAVAGYIDNIFKKKMLLKLHWIFICLMMAITLVLMVITDIIRFNSSSNTLQDNLLYGAFILIVSLVVYGTLSISTHMKRINKGAIAAAIAILPVASITISTMSLTDYDYWENDASIYIVSPPPALMFATPISVDEHLEKTEELFAYLDSLTGFEDFDEGIDNQEDSLPSSIPMIITEADDEQL